MFALNPNKISESPKELGEIFRRNINLRDAILEAIQIKTRALRMQGIGRQPSRNEVVRTIRATYPRHFNEQIVRKCLRELISKGLKIAGVRFFPLGEVSEAQDRFEIRFHRLAKALGRPPKYFELVQYYKDLGESACNWEMIRGTFRRVNRHRNKEDRLKITPDYPISVSTAAQIAYRICSSRDGIVRREDFVREVTKALGRKVSRRQIIRVSIHRKMKLQSGKLEPNVVVEAFKDASALLGSDPTTTECLSYIRRAGGSSGIMTLNYEIVKHHLVAQRRRKKLPPVEIYRNTGTDRIDFVLEHAIAIWDRSEASTLHSILNTPRAVTAKRLTSPGITELGKRDCITFFEVAQAAEFTPKSTLRFIEALCHVVKRGGDEFTSHTLGRALKYFRNHMITVLDLDSDVRNELNMLIDAMIGRRHLTKTDIVRDFLIPAVNVHERSRKWIARKTEDDLEPLDTSFELLDRVLRDSFYIISKRPNLFGQRLVMPSANT